MKAILIKPDHEMRSVLVSTVEVLEQDGDASLQCLYRHTQADTVQIRGCHPEGQFKGHALIVDQDGLFKQVTGYIYHPAISPDPISGHIVLMAFRENRTLTDATLDEGNIRQVLGKAYCSPEMAVLLARANEDRIRRDYPGVIVIPGSEMILRHF